MKLHERGQIGKAHVVGARCHALDGAARAAAGIHRHIEPRSLEIALGDWLQK